MKIEALEVVKHHPHYLQPGDIITIDDETGDYLVGNGWCKNVETGEVGDRVAGAKPVTLDIHNGAIGTSDTGA